MKFPTIAEGVLVTSLPISPFEGFLVSRMDGRTTIEDIANSTGASRDAVLALLEKLEELGAVAYLQEGPPRTSRPTVLPPRQSTPPPQDPELGYNPEELEEDAELSRERKEEILKAYYGLGEGNHYEVLGVPQDAPKKDIRNAYFLLSKRFHPDTLFGKNLGSFQGKMETVFKRLTEAYEVLGKKKKRAQYDRQIQLTAKARRLNEGMADVVDASEPKRKAAVSRRPRTGIPTPRSTERPAMVPPPSVPPAPRTPMPTSPGTLRSGVAGAGETKSTERPASERPGASRADSPRSDSQRAGSKPTRSATPDAGASSSPPPGSVVSGNVVSRNAPPSTPIPGASSKAGRSPASSKVVGSVPPGSVVTEPLGAGGLGKGAASPAPEKSVSGKMAPGKSVPGASASALAGTSGKSAAARRELAESALSEPHLSEPPGERTSGTRRRSDSTQGHRSSGARLRPEASDTTRRPVAASSETVGATERSRAKQRELQRRLLERRLGVSRPAAKKTPKQSDRKSLLRGLAASLKQSASVTGGVDRVERHLADAAAAEKLGDIVGAVNALRLAMSMEPDREDIEAKYRELKARLAKEMASAYERQALHEEQQGQWLQASRSWVKAFEGKPSSARIARRAATALLEANDDLRQARDLAQRAVELAPRDVESRVLLGRIFVKAGMSASAKRELQHASKLDPTNDFVKNLLRELK